MIRLLKLSNVNFYTFQLKQEQSFCFVPHNVHHSVHFVDVKDKLKDLGHEIINELDFSGTAKVIDLNKRTLNCAGIWPESIHEPIFVFFSTYLAIHCTLAIVDITDHILDMEYVTSSIAENMFNLMTLLKICICRLKRKSLVEFLKDIQIDLTPGRYKTPEEKTAFLAYNNFSLKFVQISMILCIIAATMYYVVVLIPNVKMGKSCYILLLAKIVMLRFFYFYY
ncbi:hypothetical protein M0804_014028 [Polistes exclamans]|nr:hypothetical protein M0804_014028 [Polistes exclamans]